MLLWVQGLVRAGAMRPADRPVWCQVYEAFPPAQPPHYQRPLPPPTHAPALLYPEDLVRVQFYKTYGNPDVVDLTNERVKTTCQRFVDKYLELVQSQGPGTDVFEATALALRDQGLRLRSLAQLQDGSAATALALRDQGLRLRSLAQLQDGSAPAASRQPLRTSPSAQEPRLSVASIFGQDTAARAGSDDDDYVDVDDPTEKDPGLSR
ncbi:hypothetical protein ACOMHN_045842 [Nucella lapillus]